jgi:tryptophan synthase alpha chain
MNRIDETFNRLKQNKEKALIGFVTAGDPEKETSMRIIDAMCRSGIDILELGVPFSDPTADGPVIQRSSARALKNGTTLASVLDMTRQLRESHAVPIVIFSYYNPILMLGPENFYQLAVNAGADGLLVVDLPPEESAELTDKWPGRELHLIRLVAPTTPVARMRQIAESGSGFLYLVSKTGVTGSDGLKTDEAAGKTAKLRDMTNLPVCVGFGISNPQDVAAIAAFADGIVIGSAFERTIEDSFGQADLVTRISEQVSQYKEATRL